MDSLEQLAGLNSLGGLSRLNSISPQPQLQSQIPQQTTSPASLLPDDYMPFLPTQMPRGPAAYNNNYFISPQQANSMKETSEPSYKDNTPIPENEMAKALTNIIKAKESSGNYQAVNPKSTASGAYQYTDSTWNGYGGYSRAALAPPAVQDAKFAQDVRARLAAFGGDPYKAIVAHYLPALANDPSKWSQPFRVHGRVVRSPLSYLQYVVHGTPLQAGLQQYLVNGRQPNLLASAG